MYGGCIALSSTSLVQTAPVLEDRKLYNFATRDQVTYSQSSKLRLIDSGIIAIPFCYRKLSLYIQTVLG